MKRNRLEVIYDILKIIHDNNNSIRPTPLLRKSNISSARFQEYSSELLKNGFVKEIIDNKGTKFLTLTDKGFKYLEKYNSILNFINEFGL